MPTNQQRRDAERRRLKRQLEERRSREMGRKRAVLIGSIVGTVVLVAVVAIVIGVTIDTNKGSKSADRLTRTPTTSLPPSTTSAAAAGQKPCAKPPPTSTAQFKGLTVSRAADLARQPQVSGKSATDPSTVACSDLVIGSGPIAAVNSTVTAQYVGVVYRTGKVFQSSWGVKPEPSFRLAPGAVIDGFREGIAGAGKIQPMRVGGRRLIIMPASAAYGASPPDSSIPPNASLAFIVDLTKVT